jgi:hypothetical protein
MMRCKHSALGGFRPDLRAHERALHPRKVQSGSTNEDALHVSARFGYDSVSRLMKSLLARARLSLLFVCACAWACSSEDGGPSRTTVGAELETSSGTPPAVCVRLPALLGSQTEASVQIGNAFEISVHALRHTATIKFPGARNDATATRNLSLTQLTSGYADVVTVTGSDGVDYRVQVRSGCSETLPEDP